VSCFSGDSLFANAFARGWISELCCPCDLSTFNLQTKNNAHMMMILTFFMAIFLQYSSTLIAPMLFEFGETWIKFLAFASCAMYIVLNKQLKTCYEENERNVNITVESIPSLLDQPMALFHQPTHGSLIVVGLSFQSLWQLQTSIAHSIEIMIIIILDMIHFECAIKHRHFLFL
jgi:hypothetical protein